MSPGVLHINCVKNTTTTLTLLSPLYKGESSELHDNRRRYEAERLNISQTKHCVELELVVVPELETGKCIKAPSAWDWAQPRSPT